MDAALSPDPLIAEAKRRGRRRRSILVLLLLTAAVALAVVLRPHGGSGTARIPRQQATDRALAHLKVPMDSAERQWRAQVRAMQGVAAPRSEVLERRRDVLRVVRATGATVVRITIWRRTSPLAVELVVATANGPAFYLRHRAERLVNVLRARPQYLRIVGPHGGLLMEWGGAANEGFVGAPRSLQACSPVFAWGEWGLVPCPVK